MRPARMTDQAVLAELDALAWSADAGFPSIAGFKDGTFFSTDNPPEAHLVAELNGSVVGYIRLKPPTRLPENAHVIQVQGLAVHPDARRHGAAGQPTGRGRETVAGTRHPQAHPAGAEHQPGSHPAV